MKKYFIIALAFFSMLMLIGIGMQSTERQKESVSTLYLYIDEDQLEELYSRDPLSEDRITGYAKLSPNGVSIPLDGLRFRGNYLTRIMPKKSLNIRFQDGQEFLFGSDRMNLNASNTDSTLMREMLSMEMFAYLGQPAPRTKYFDLYINDVYEGLYVHVERIDEDLLKSTGLNPEGTLVRDDFRNTRDNVVINRNSLFGFDIDSIDDRESFLQENFEFRGEPKWEELAELASWVYNTPEGEDFEIGFKERFDVDNYIDWLAIHFLIGDIDSFGDDYWLYLDHNDHEARWIIIPWDKDLTFGSYFRFEYGTDNDFFAYDYPLISGWNNELIEKFLATDGLRNSLYDRMDFLMHNVFTEEYFESRIQELFEIVGDRIDIPQSDSSFKLHLKNHHGELGSLEYNLEVLRDFIELRYQFIKSHINKTEYDKFYAVKNMNDYKEGDTVFFTDSLGLVMAKLEINNIVKSGQIEMWIEQAPLFKHPIPIDKLWRINTNDSEVQGELTLYYRNDILDLIRRDYNWYIEPVPIKSDVFSQWNLGIELKNSNGKLEDISPRINPYSNKAVFEIKLKGEMELKFKEDGIDYSKYEKATLESGSKWDYHSSWIGIVEKGGKVLDEKLALGESGITSVRSYYITKNNQEIHVRSTQYNDETRDNRFIMINRRVYFGTRGISVAIIDQNGNRIHTATYDTHGKPEDSDALAKLIKETPDGYILIFSTYDEFTRSITPNLTRQLKALGFNYVP